MARDRAVVQAFSGDGPTLVAIHDVLADLYDLLDARLPRTDGGPARISEPAPAGPSPTVRSVSEPAPDGPPGDEDPASSPAPGLPAPPPRAGRGASQSAWSAWACRAGVTVPGGASREDIIDACQSAGVLSTT